MANKHKNPLIAKISSDAFLFYEKYYQALKTDEDWRETTNELKQFIKTKYSNNPFCEDMFFTYLKQLEREYKEEINNG